MPKQDLKIAYLSNTTNHSLSFPSLGLCPVYNSQGTLKRRVLPRLSLKVEAPLGTG